MRVPAINRLGDLEVRNTMAEIKGILSGEGYTSAAPSGCKRSRLEEIEFAARNILLKIVAEKCMNNLDADTPDEQRVRTYRLYKTYFARTCAILNYNIELTFDAATYMARQTIMYGHGEDRWRASVDTFYQRISEGRKKKKYDPEVCFVPEHSSPDEQYKFLWTFFESAVPPLFPRIYEQRVKFNDNE